MEKVDLGEKIAKSNSVCTSYQAQLTDGWWFLHRFSIRTSIKDKVGRMTFPIYCKKYRLSELFIINFENTASPKYIVQKAKSL